MANVWSYGGDLNFFNNAFGSCGSSRNAGLAWAGDGDPAKPLDTEEYDGSTWASGGDYLNWVWGPSGIGTQTAALSVAGYRGYSDQETTDVNEYDGSSWSAGTDITLARSDAEGAGTVDACFITGGFCPDLDADSISKKTEDWDGTSWSAGPNLNQRRWSCGAVGSATAGLIFSGGTSQSDAVWWIWTHTDSVEEYDGTAWTTVSPVSHGGAQYVGGAGTQTAALSIGAIYDPDYVDDSLMWTGEYDGSSWASGSPTLEAGIVDCGGAGTQTAALCIGGYSYHCEHYDTCEIGYLDDSYWVNGGEEWQAQWDGTKWISGSASYDIDIYPIGSWATGFRPVGVRVYHDKGSAISNLIIRSTEEYDPCASVTDYVSGSWIELSYPGGADIAGLYVATGDTTTAVTGIYFCGFDEEPPVTLVQPMIWVCM